MKHLTYSRRCDGATRVVRIEMEMKLKLGRLGLNSYCSKRERLWKGRVMDRERNSRTKGSYFSRCCYGGHSSITSRLR